MTWQMDSFSPTAEQARIADAQDERLVVDANAGVGKTTTICLRALGLTERGADPSRILMLSFSEPGCEAIRRSLQALPAPAATRAQLLPKTFDQFCAARLARLETDTVRRFSQPEEVKPFVLHAIARARELAEGYFPGAFVLEGSGELAVEQLLADFERIKGSMVLQRQSEEFRLTPETAGETGFEYTTLAVFYAYEHLRREGGPGGEGERFQYRGDATYDLACVLTADDPVFSHDTHPLRLGAIHAVFVDEFHDMNRAMATVLQALLQAYPRVPLTVVGDVDQVIHRSSGAESYFMREGFRREFGPAARLQLTRAWRFGPDLADLLGAHAGKAFPAQAHRDTQVSIRPLSNPLTLALHIKQLFPAGAEAQRRAARRDVAVLLRHPNAALGLEYHLMDQGVAYETRGFTSYLQRPEVLFVRMLLAKAVGGGAAFTPKSLDAAKLATWAFVGGALQTAELGDDPDTAAKLLKAGELAFRGDLFDNLLKRTPRTAGARRIRGAMALAADDRLESSVAALTALRIEQLAGKVFVNAESVQDAGASIHALLKLVESKQHNAISDLLRVLRLQEERRELARPASRLVLSTIPQAKGLEFDHVIVPDVSSDSFDGPQEDTKHLFYVAASRARHVLELMYREGAASSYIAAHPMRGNG